MAVIKVECSNCGIEFGCPPGLKDKHHLCAKCSNDKSVKNEPKPNKVIKVKTTKKIGDK